VSYNDSSLEPNITAAVRAMAAAHPGAPLYVLGHSMGAALATICAMDVKFKANLTDVRLYTFGSPRVGNDKFAAFVANQTTVRMGTGASLGSPAVHTMHAASNLQHACASKAPPACDSTVPHACKSDVRHACRLKCSMHANHKRRMHANGKRGMHAGCAGELALHA
jgi:hypothetical protein